MDALGPTLAVDPEKDARQGRSYAALVPERRILPAGRPVVKATLVRVIPGGRSGRGIAASDLGGAGGQKREEAPGIGASFAGFDEATGYGAVTPA